MKDDNWNLLHMRGGIRTLKAAKNRDLMPTMRPTYHVAGEDVTDVIEAYIHAGLLDRVESGRMVLTNRGQSLLKEYDDIMIEDTSAEPYAGCDPS